MRRRQSRLEAGGGWGGGGGGSERLVQVGLVAARKNGGRLADSF